MSTEASAEVRKENDASESAAADPAIPLPPPKKDCTSLTDVQRTKIFSRMCMARFMENCLDDKKPFTMKMYDRACILMNSELYPIGLTRTPTYATLRGIWNNFIKTGLATRKRAERNGRPKKHRLEVRAIMDANPHMNCTEIRRKARNDLGLSRSTVHTIVKELDRERRSELKKKNRTSNQSAKAVKSAPPDVGDNETSDHSSVG